MDIAHIALSVLKYIFVISIGAEAAVVLWALVRLAREKAQPATAAPATEE